MYNDIHSLLWHEGYIPWAYMQTEVFREMDLGQSFGTSSIIMCTQALFLKILYCM